MGYADAALLVAEYSSDITFSMSGLHVERSWNVQCSSVLLRSYLIGSSVVSTVQCCSLYAFAEVPYCDIDSDQDACLNERPTVLGSGMGSLQETKGPEDIRLLARAIHTTTAIQFDNRRPHLLVLGAAKPTSCIRWTMFPLHHTSDSQTPARPPRPSRGYTRAWEFIRWHSTMWGLWVWILIHRGPDPGLVAYVLSSDRASGLEPQQFDGIV